MKFLPSKTPANPIEQMQLPLLNQANLKILAIKQLRTRFGHLFIRKNKRKTLAKDERKSHSKELCRLCLRVFGTNRFSTLPLKRKRRKTHQNETHIKLSTESVNESGSRPWEKTTVISQLRTAQLVPRKARYLCHRRLSEVVQKAA